MTLADAEAVRDALERKVYSDSASEYDAGHVRLNPACRFGYLGQAVMQDLALFAPLVVRGGRKNPRSKLFANGVNDGHHLIPQCVGEFDLHAPPRATVPNAARRDSDAKHFFEAQCLRTELEVRGEAVPDAGFVLHRPNQVAIYLHNIGASGQSQRLRPERNASKDLAAPLRAVMFAIHASVRPRASDGVNVVGPNAIAVDQCALARAVDEVFNRGDRYDGFEGHSISAPNALVVSAEALRR